MHAAILLSLTAFNMAQLKRHTLTIQLLHRSWLSRTLSQWEAMLLGAIVAIVIVETLRVIVAKSWLYVS